MAIRTVSSSCQNCALCRPGNAFQGAGRNTGRAAADLATLGISALARKKCRSCDHPASEHADMSAQSYGRSEPSSTVVNGRIYFAQPAAQSAHLPASTPQDRPVQPAPPALPPAGWYPESGRVRYWDGHNWTDHYA